jgi:hypothetical protein
VSVGGIVKIVRLRTVIDQLLCADIFVTGNGLVIGAYGGWGRFEIILTVTLMVRSSGL